MTQRRSLIFLDARRVKLPFSTVLHLMDCLVHLQYFRRITVLFTARYNTVCSGHALRDTSKVSRIVATNHRLLGIYTAKEDSGSSEIYGNLFCSVSTLYEVDIVPNLSWKQEAKEVVCHIDRIKLYNVCKATCSFVCSIVLLTYLPWALIQFICAIIHNRGSIRCNSYFRLLQLYGMRMYR